jgi:hypothetical protein
VHEKFTQSSKSSRSEIKWISISLGRSTKQISFVFRVATHESEMSCMWFWFDVGDSENFKVTDLSRVGQYLLYLIASDRRLTASDSV